MRFTLTCQSWLESLVRRETERLWLTELSGRDRMVSASGSEKNMYELLIWSRFANRVYLNLLEEKIVDFDDLFRKVYALDWQRFLGSELRYIVDASSTRSVLSSTPALQSVTERAIQGKLSRDNGKSEAEIHVLVLVIDDTVQVLLDITGEALHKRGYRREAGEAPIKENLAAALVAFSGWRYRESLLDPFAGSGTIPIEAAMMARNIAPGLERTFRIEDLPFYSIALLRESKLDAKAKQYPSGDYTLFASDIDTGMLDIARENARRAGVLGDITFEARDFLSTASLSNTKSTIVTNPPYGKRMGGDHLEEIYMKLISEIAENGGGFITSYELLKDHHLANKKLLNGNEECRFWYRK